MNDLLVTISIIASNLVIIFMLLAGLKAINQSASIWAKLIFAGSLLSIFGFLVPNILVSETPINETIIEFSSFAMSMGMLTSTIGVWKFVSIKNT